MRKKFLTSFPKDWVIKSGDKEVGPNHLDKPSSSRLLVPSLPASWKKPPSFDTASIATSQWSDVSRFIDNSPRTLSQNDDTASQRSFRTQATTGSSQRSYLPGYKPEWTLATAPQSQPGHPVGVTDGVSKQDGNDIVLVHAARSTAGTAGTVAGELPVDFNANAVGHPDGSSSSAFDPRVVNLAGYYNDAVLVAGNIARYGGVADGSSSAQASASADPRSLAGDISGYHALVSPNGGSSSDADPFQMSAGWIPREPRIYNFVQDGSSSSAPGDAYAVGHVRNILAGQLPPEVIPDSEGSRDSAKVTSDGMT
ncbi:hypothetical protein F4809DRAFT_642610 [Biscogniauxia mediterranea]|nr:hypothetical protein F4809DRAFT_642610 [Biscogniauxia mediterranea]